MVLRKWLKIDIDKSVLGKWNESDSDKKEYYIVIEKRKWWGRGEKWR